jgi:hypothetical protein
VRFRLAAMLVVLSTAVAHGDESLRVSAQRGCMGQDMECRTRCGLTSDTGPQREFDPAAFKSCREACDDQLARCTERVRQAFDAPATAR